jgi:hypothetical protein
MVTAQKTYLPSWLRLKIEVKEKVVIGRAGGSSSVVSSTVRRVSQHRNFSASVISSRWISQQRISIFLPQSAGSTCAIVVRAVF